MPRRRHITTIHEFGVNQSRARSGYRATEMRRTRIVLCTAAVAVAVMVLVRPVSGAAPAVSGGGQRSTVSVSKEVKGIKEMNYFPAHAGWTFMWTDFNPKAIDRDFGRIHALGANTVRIIVPPNTFGYPTVTQSMAKRLHKVVKLAAKHSLRIQLTLFEWWSAYSDIAGSKKWVKSLLAPYRNDDRIAVVELRNEVNPGSTKEVDWVRKLLPYLKKVMPGTLRTVSTPYVIPKEFKSFTHELRHSPPDFWDYHYYGTSFGAYWELHKIRALAGSRPLFIGETGYSTVGPRSKRKSLDRAQAHYYRLVFRAARRLGLPNPAPWILDDFAQGAIPPQTRAAGEPWQYDFGLYRVNGTRKKAASVVSEYFARR